LLGEEGCEREREREIEIDEWAVQAMCTLLAAWVEIWVRACAWRVGSGVATG